MEVLHSNNLSLQLWFFFVT